MQSSVMKGFVVLFAVILLSLVSVAQTPERVDFEKQGPALVWEQRVAAKGSKSFVFFAKKGQKLLLSFIDDTNVGSMDLGKFSVEPNGDGLEMVIEVSKDYTFSVTNNSNKATSFRIFITLEKDKADGGSNASSEGGADSNFERVTFAAGESSTYLTRNIPANDSHEFIFNARKGQTLGFTVAYDFKVSDVEAFLTEPGSQDISLTTGPKAPNEFVVQKTGDHRLLVRNLTRKKITITLYLDIETTGKDSASGDADAPYSERVQFPKGAVDVRFERTINANYEFIFYARKGQRVNFDVGGNTALDIFLYEPTRDNPKLKQVPDQLEEFIVQTTGDHHITVKNTSGKRTKITFYLYIE